MRLASCITTRRLLLQGSGLLIVILWLAEIGCGQRLAVITPNRSSSDEAVAAALAAELAKQFDVQDRSMTEAAYRAVAPKLPFNMTLDEAKTVGSAIACDYFILIRSETLRRSSFQKSEYYESFATIYIVASKSGKLEDWRNFSAEHPTPAASFERLIDSMAAAEMSSDLKKLSTSDHIDKGRPPMQELPADNSNESKNFRAPIPFARIKPAYTDLAFLYEVAATVEIEVDLDAAGTVLRTSIVRWAGYGLDESVESTVRKMNWRPAERNGKSLPMRVLLRYNFKKIDK